MSARALPVWFKERFPLAPYSVLVALFFGSAVAVGRALRTPSGDVYWPGALLLLLVFLHLRIFDEHKDSEDDRRFHPERALSRGLVTLDDLKVLGGLALAAELALAAGGRVLGTWGLTYTFTLFMAREFGVGPFLRKHIVLYAITHNPVVAGLALVALDCARVGWGPELLPYVIMISVGSLGFEVGRKIRLPEEEIPGLESYSSALGRGGAIALLVASVLGGAACLGVLLHSLGESPFFAVIPLLPLALARGPAKRVELAATLALLLMMVVAWGAAWA